MHTLCCCRFVSFLLSLCVHSILARALMLIRLMYALFCCCCCLFYLCVDACVKATRILSIAERKKKSRCDWYICFFFPCGNLTFGCVSLGTSMRPKLSRTFNIHAYNGTGHSHTMPQQFRSIYEIRWISFDRERANERAHTPRVSCTRRTSHILYFDSVVFLHHIFTYSSSPSRGCFCLLAWLLQPI